MRHARMISEADLSSSKDSRRSQSAKSVSHLNEMVSSFAIRSVSGRPLMGLDVWGDFFEVLEAQRRARLREKAVERRLRNANELRNGVQT